VHAAARFEPPTLPTALESSDVWLADPGGFAAVDRNAGRRVPDAVTNEKPGRRNRGERATPTPSRVESSVRLRRGNE